MSWWKEKEKIINNCWKPSAIDWNETKRLQEGKDEYTLQTLWRRKKWKKEEKKIIIIIIIIMRTIIIIVIIIINPRQRTRSGLTKSRHEYEYNKKKN